jgi:hypothetical protein
MIRFSVRRLAVLGLSAAFVLALGGCWNPFAPDEGDPVDRPPADYRLRTTPANVIHNMQVAYEYMDAEKYLACLSEDFVFYPNEEDVGGPDNIPEFWYKDTERTLHENMFSENPPDPSLAVESIQLTLTLANRDSIEGDQPGEWNVIFEESVDLHVNLYTGLTYYANAPSEYRLRKAEEPGPNGEVLWEVYEWYDLLEDDKRAAGHDPGVEVMTLAELKSRFFELEHH